VKLVEVFTAAGATSIELAAEGNLPAFTARLKPYYKANISAEWDDERRERGFKWLTDNEAGDLIKRAFTIEFGRTEGAEAERLRAVLEQLELSYNEKLAVNHQTLTAWFKERVEKRLPLPEQLEVIGAQRGQIVEVKPVKEKSTKRARE
jgi:hypothetical protein